MEKIEEQVFACIDANKKYLVAVSGGADSMVLLFLADKIAKEKDATVRAITVDHGIRGESSKSDAQFVCDFCSKHNIACKLVSVDVLTHANQNKQTIEEGARELRYKAFFEELLPDETLLVAHNQNDQAETVLMHIFRGSGIDGAKGISQSERIKRPLLDVSKKEIVEYAQKNNILFVFDQTNDDTAYYRNFVRKEILPKIEQIYPNVVENIAKFADFCAQSEELIESQIKKEWLEKTNNTVQISDEALSSHPLVFAKTIKKAYNMLGEYADLESKHISIIAEFWTQTKDGQTINIPHNVVVEKRKNNLIFYKKPQNNKEVCNFQLGKNVLPDGSVILVEKIKNDEIDYASKDFFADYYKIPFDSVWRTRAEGDMFAKLGSRGHKKLNDYFTDKKFDFAKRSTQILLAAKNNVLLVVGADVSDDIKIDDKTECVVRFKIL